MSSSFPTSFVQDKAFLKDIFLDEAAGLGLDLENAKRLFESLPEKIRDSQAIKIKVLPSSWRYVFGDNFNIGKRTAVSVPYQMPLVSSLIRAFRVAKQNLNLSQHETWIERFASPLKHYDALVEMLVVSNVKPEYMLSYEKRGSGVRGGHIDWLLESNDRNYLLEVKNRPGQIAQDLEQRITNGQLYPYDLVPDFEKLFKSTVSKFHIPTNHKCIQGIALFLSLKISKASIENYFINQIQEKVHFVALVEEEGARVNLIASSEDIKSQVLSAFGWVDDAGFLYAD